MQSTTTSSLIDTAVGPQIHACPVCQTDEFVDDFVSQGFQVQYCRGCQLKMLNPQPSDQVLASIYDHSYALSSETAEVKQTTEAMKRATARLYLDMLREYSDCQSGRLLEIGCGSGDLLVEAEARGFQVTGVEYSPYAAELAQLKLGAGAKVYCGEVERLPLPSASFDVCILSDVLEHVRNPAQFLSYIHGLLKDDGIIFLATPSLDSWSARLLGRRWIEYKTEHLYYFNRATLETLLFATNFDRVLLRPNYKVLTPGYIAAHFDRYETPLFTPLMRLAKRLMPAVVSDHQIKLVASGVVAIARKQARTELFTSRRAVSVIMPVFNERATFSQVMEQLLEKEIDGLDIEIIVVESNSTDGTRDEVLKYQDHPRVRVILEARPNGKGHAVRTGLAHATGDFILIQDADLEYDMDDYEELLAPLRAGTAAFVLGSRHNSGGHMKMRHFADQPLLSGFFNFGHIFFTFLVNLIYWQKLKDPFTMYKVFRRDCLFGLKFECQRFDFDYELVIKLLRKGYRAIEIPVSYCSRSYGEGKKVSIWRDPLTWIKALIKFRITRLNLAANAREANLREALKSTEEN